MLVVTGEHLKAVGRILGLPLHSERKPRLLAYISNQAAAWRMTRIIEQSVKWSAFLDMWWKITRTTVCQARVAWGCCILNRSCPTLAHT